MKKDNFICTVKVGDKLLREKGGRVGIPFGSEYSLLLKNLEGRRASVRVSIDGEDVLGGRSLIINQNSTLELERFIEDSLQKGRRFRFIKKTKEIMEYRGDRIDDGLIRIEFAFEKSTRHVDVDYHYRWNYWPWWSTWQYTAHPESGPVVYGYCSTNLNESTGFYNSVAGAIPNPDEGITTRGSESRQGFTYGHLGELDPPEVITIQLYGEEEFKTGGLPGTIPVKPISRYCPTCGRNVKTWDKFCSHCGTSLG